MSQRQASTHKLARRLTNEAIMGRCPTRFRCNYIMMPGGRKDNRLNKVAYCDEIAQKCLKRRSSPKKAGGITVARIELTWKQASQCDLQHQAGQSIISISWDDWLAQTPCYSSKSPRIAYPLCTDCFRTHFCWAYKCKVNLFLNTAQTALASLLGWVSITRNEKAKLSKTGTRDLLEN